MRDKNKQWSNAISYLNFLFIDLVYLHKLNFHKFINVNIILAINIASR